MNNARRADKQHAKVTPSPERTKAVVSAFADAEQRQRDYNEQVAAGNRERELARQIAAGEREPNQVSLHDDPPGYEGLHDPAPVRVVSSTGQTPGSGWSRLIASSQAGLREDAAADRNYFDPDLDPDTVEREPKAESLAKFGPSTRPA